MLYNFGLTRDEIKNAIFLGGLGHVITNFGDLVIKGLC
jgi:hypothetical protein